MVAYPKPGRGAWTRTGGLLPGKPGGSGSTGYYRLSGAGEDPIGSLFLTGADTSHDAQVVTMGVMALQAAIGVEDDGWYGALTDRAMRLAQKRLGVEVDGVCGPATMKALLMAVITNFSTALGIPVAILGGLLQNESALDPAAVGVNGMDHGLAQINLGAHPDVALNQALDPAFAIHFSAEDLIGSHDSWKGRTSVDPWKIAIAHHNSPLLAKRWAVSGVAPVEAGRAFQIEDYVNRVLAIW